MTIIFDITIHVYAEECLRDEILDWGVAKYFMSSHLGRTITTSIEQITEGFAGIGANYVRRRFFPSW